MATNTAKNKQRRPQVEFLQIDLTKAMRGELTKWLESGPDFWDIIEKCIDSGLKFSMSYDAYNDCSMASLTKLPEGNAGGTTLVLVGRGPDCYKAMQALFFKYEVVLQHNWESNDWRNARGITDWS